MKYVCATWVAHDLSLRNREERVELVTMWLNYFENHVDVSNNLLVIDEKWMYLKTIGSKAGNKSWITAHQARPRITRRQITDQKCLLIMALSFSGKCCVDILDPFKTMDSNRYIDFLKRVNYNFSRHLNPLPFQNMVLIMDNARPHVSRETQAFIAKKQINILRQPAYSPDFNLLDRFAFNDLERGRKNINFDNKNELLSFVQSHVKTFKFDRMQRQFQYLKNDLQAIINAQGNYL